jgi:hypothetical protein
VRQHRMFWCWPDRFKVSLADGTRSEALRSYSPIRFRPSLRHLPFVLAERLLAGRSKITCAAPGLDQIDESETPSASTFDGPVRFDYASRTRRLKLETCLIFDS